MQSDELRRKTWSGNCTEGWKEYNRAATFLSTFGAERYLLSAFHDATHPPGKPYEMPPNPRTSRPVRTVRYRKTEELQDEDGKSAILIGVVKSNSHVEAILAGESMQVVSLTNQGPVLAPRQMEGDASSTVCDMRKLYSLAISHSTSPLDGLSPA